MIGTQSGQPWTEFKIPTATSPTGRYDESMPTNHNSPVSHVIRLLQLIQELQLRPRQTPKELCARLGIKRSTFHNDIKALAAAGFAWTYNRRQRAYLGPSEGVPPVLNLSLTEAMALVMAVQQFSASGDSTLLFEAVEGLKKLIAAMPESTRKLLSGALDEILRTTFHATPVVVDDLIKAQKLRHRVFAVYNDRSRKKQIRYEIAPYQIFFQARALYLDAFIYGENRLATLRVSRIEKVEPCDWTFEVAAEYDFTERHHHTFRAFRSDRPPQRVKLRFDAKVADLIRESRWHVSEQKSVLKDGSLILELTVADPREVLWYLVMPYAQELEILEPEWLRKEFLRIAQRVIERIGNQSE